MRKALPAWQSARTHAGQAGGEASRALLASARRWPEVAAGFDAMDRAWPNDAEVRAAGKSVNRALATARLPYFVDIQRVGSQPIALSYELVARVPWRIGARTVDVLRLRRLDTLNIELGMYGATDEGLPVVLVDRIESDLANTLPAMYGREGEMARHLNDFDRAALARERRLLEARVGAGLGAAAADLAERDRLLEVMRTRLHGGELQFDPPDGFVLGEPWLSNLEQYARFDRPGGPLLFDTDLHAVVRADEKLRAGATAQVLAAAVDVLASATEAHEARHALDEVEPRRAAAAARAVRRDGRELGAVRRHGRRRAARVPRRAARHRIGRVLGGGQDVARRVRAGRAPDAALLRDADHPAPAGPRPDRAPAARLALLCDMPDAELRQRVAAAWQKLYGAPLLPGQRVAAP